MPQPPKVPKLKVGDRVSALWNSEGRMTAAGERPLHERGGKWKPATVRQIVLQTAFGSKRWPVGTVLAVYVEFDDALDDIVSVAPDEVRWGAGIALPPAPVRPTPG